MLTYDTFRLIDQVPHPHHLQQASKTFNKTYARPKSRQLRNVKVVWEKFVREKTLFHRRLVTAGEWKVRPL